MTNDRITEQGAAGVLTDFGLDNFRLRSDIFIPGSPERCVARVVVQSDVGGLWMLERLYPAQVRRRESVARVMARLSDRGLTVVPAFRSSKNGGFVLRRDGWDWQIAPYVAGDPLPQPEYVLDAGRGRSLGAFVVDLHRLSPEVSEGLEDEFSLPRYMDELLAAIGRNRPELLDAVRPVRASLIELDEAWEELPRTLAHGDLHPLNVIWRGQDVRSVIDWEFCAMRPEFYDVANLLGCTGSEDPKYLASGLARACLDELRKADVLTLDNGRWLFPLFLGLRFAWFSEWLRRADEPMLEMEIAYMQLLLNSRSDLERLWLG